MVYLTGDTHGAFRRLEGFCERFNTTKDDILIILGDAGFNFDGYYYDAKKKARVQALPITVFCIHGNHEMRPETLEYYRETKWHAGTVFVEDEFPDIFFAKDGEVYDFLTSDGSTKKAIAIGGAYSVDKQYRILNNWGWWADEQPSKEIKKRVEQVLAERDWNIDIVLSHTVPEKYMPVENFISGVEQSSVDRTTEKWLEKIEAKLSYDKWYAGHFHCEKQVNEKFKIMFEGYCEL